MSQLVEHNEKLEKQVKQMDGDREDVGAEHLTVTDLLRLLETERKASARLTAENAQLKDRLKRVKRPSESTTSRQETVDIEVSSTKLGALGAVSFKKVSVEGRRSLLCISGGTLVCAVQASFVF